MGSNSEYFRFQESIVSRGPNRFVCGISCVSYSAHWTVSRRSFASRCPLFTPRPSPAVLSGTHLVPELTIWVTDRRRKHPDVYSSRGQESKAGILAGIVLSGRAKRESRFTLTLTPTKGEWCMNGLPFKGMTAGLFSLFLAFSVAAQASDKKHFLGV